VGFTGTVWNLSFGIRSDAPSRPDQSPCAKEVMYSTSYSTSYSTVTVTVQFCRNPLGGAISFLNQLWK
jgi:hypothetical protein